MFKRRTQQPVHHRVGYFLWPRTGFRRASSYLWHRIGRLHGTPHSVAVGFAFGAAISFTPFVGLHLVLAALTAWLARANIMAGLLGTAVGNPWTFPFIWLWIYGLGSRMGAGDAAHSEPRIISVIVDLPGVVWKALISFDLDWAYFDNLWAVFWPMLVGAVPTAIVVWVVTYVLLRPVVATYQRQRIIRRNRKAARRAARAAEKAGKSVADQTAEAIMPASAGAPELKQETRG